MDTFLMILGILLVAIMGISLRSMREEHLYAISNRLEMSIWFIFTLIFVGQFVENVHNAIDIPYSLQVIIAGVMMARILSSISFILGNPPKVRIGVRSKAKPHKEKIIKQRRPSLFHKSGERKDDLPGIPF